MGSADSFIRFGSDIEMEVGVKEVREVIASLEVNASLDDRPAGDDSDRTNVDYFGYFDNFDNSERRRRRRTKREQDIIHNIH